MHRNLGLFFLCVLPLLSACSQSGPATTETAAQAQTGGVAVIDLDEVARQLGRELSIKQSLTAREASLNQQLESMRVQYANLLNQRKQELTEQPASGEIAQVQAFEKQAVAKIQQARQQAQNHLLTEKKDLITAFREEVKPVAAEVAAKRGLSIVISKNETFLFAFDDGVDITHDVVMEMRNNGAAQPAASPASTPDSTSPAAPASPEGLGSAPQRFNPPAAAQPAAQTASPRSLPPTLPAATN